MGLFDYFSAQPAQDAAMAQKDAIRLGTQQGQDLLKTGLDTSTQQYTQGVAPFLSNLDTTQRGQTAYANALGVNGPQGNAQAVANFQGSPGYQYGVDQATQNYMRNAASTGSLGSGNTAAGITGLAQNLANQNWQQYVGNLQPFIGASTANAGGAQAGYNAMAGNTAQNYGTQANLAYGSNVAQGNAQAAYDMAPANASANLWNFGLNAAKAAASFIPGTPK
jgi:hypothetical protein